MFVKVIRKSTLTTFTLLTACTAAGWLLLAWPRAVSTGISRGLAICSSVIIPSLFPFLVLADFIIRSGISDKIGKLLERPVHFIFNLPGCCAPAILISLIGGYPAGGIAVGQLAKSGMITRGQAKRMLFFCINGGPAFIISAVGAGLMGNIKYGVMLYAAHIAASLIIGIFLRFCSSDVGTVQSKKPITKPTDNPSAAYCFVESVGNACRTILLMCGFIVLFAALLSLADASGFPDWFQIRAANFLSTIWQSDALKDILKCIFPCIFEVSCGTVEAAQTGTAAPLILGMALGFGGISVHCQIAASLQGLALIDRGFFVFRVLHAVLGGLFSVLLFRFVPVAVPAFRPSSDALILPFSTNAAASASLLSLCALFLLTAACRPEEINAKKHTGKKEENVLS